MDGAKRPSIAENRNGWTGLNACPPVFAFCEVAVELSTCPPVSRPLYRFFALVRDPTTIDCPGKMIARFRPFMRISAAVDV